MISDTINKLVRRENLLREEAEEAMKGIFSGTLTPAQSASFLTALRMKGETPEEIASFARVMRDFSVRITPKVSKLVDTCGTGGDSSRTINISTLSAIVSSCFVPVAKHGNRSVTSKCGSADLLEALGVKIDCSPEKTERAIEKNNLGFMFAPLYHPAMKAVAPVRKEMGIRTVFNILGPLTNPAGAKCQIIGVYGPGLCEKIAGVLKLLGCSRAMVFHGSGMDEISTAGTTSVSELRDGKVVSYELKPGDFGVRKASLSDLSVLDKDSAVNAARQILSGTKGAMQDIVAVNSSAALKVAGICESFEEGAGMCREALESGKALKQLEKLVENTNA